MSMIYASLNYTHSGRKRKSNAKPRKKISQQFTPITTKPKTYADVRLEESKKYKSAPEGRGVAERRDSPKYTGTLVKGIGTMHKSNAVPIIDEQQMKDLARMRR